MESDRSESTDTDRINFLAQHNPDTQTTVCVNVCIDEESCAPLIQLSGADPLVEFEATDFASPPAFRELPGLIVFPGAPTWSWATLLSGSGGNIYWRSYTMERRVAIAFLVWLQGSRLYDCSQAETKLFDRWCWREPLTVPFLEGYFSERARANV